MGIANALKVKLIEQILDDGRRSIHDRPQLFHFLGWVDAKLFEQIRLFTLQSLTSLPCCLSSSRMT